MARMRDEQKRNSILNTSKMLFSQKGFFNTSISDIVRETGLPVGTIYTYFTSKDEIVRTIVEEGWSDWYERLVSSASAAGPPEAKIKLLIDNFVTELINDVDFINILLSEAIEYTHIEEKLEKLTDFFFSLLKPLAKNQKIMKEFSRKSMEAALIVFFLGIMNAVSLARNTAIGLKVTDIIDFLNKLIEASFNIKPQGAL